MRYVEKISVVDCFVAAIGMLVLTVPTVTGYAALSTGWCWPRHADVSRVRDIGAFMVSHKNVVATSALIAMVIGFVAGPKCISKLFGGFCGTNDLD